MQRALSSSTSFLVGALKNCCLLSSHLYQIHAQMIKSGNDRLTFPANKLLAAASLLDISYARSLFRNSSNPDLFAHNSLLRGFSLTQNPDIQESLTLFNSLRAGDIALDQFSFLTILKICGRVSALEPAKQIHTVGLKSGFVFYVDILNSMIHVYSVCGMIGDARKMFDEIPHIRDVVTWTVLMGGYLRSHQNLEVIYIFNNMRLNCSSLSTSTIVNVISACLDSGCILEAIHGFCTKTGFCLLELNVATALTTMYAKWDRMEEAQQLFDEMPKKDVVSYNSVIDGYAKIGRVQESLLLLNQMKIEGEQPNTSTFISLLSACGSSGALEVGRWIHQLIKDEGLELNAKLGTALIEMYSKCGCLDEIFRVFNEIPQKDVKTWSAMIMACGINGRSNAAVDLFYRMEEEGVQPNGVTFLLVLDACSHYGMVKEGKKLFERMIIYYKMTPNIEHYGCFVNLLARAGMLEEAQEMIESLPCGGDATAWRALLAACKTHCDSRTAEIAREKLLSMNADNYADVILLSGAYAAEERWTDIAEMRELEEQKMAGCKKEAGKSSIQTSHRWLILPFIHCAEY